MAQKVLRLPETRVSVCVVLDETMLIKRPVIDVNINSTPQNQEGCAC